jgi:transcriptional regulator with XRE-family HTH domain
LILSSSFLLNFYSKKPTIAIGREKNVEQTFGRLIRQARKDKSYSQRELAGLLSVDFTYLSKLENDRADYPPKEEVIRALARNLDLDQEELIFLAGRLPQQYEALLRQNPKEMQALFRRMQDDPSWIKKSVH